MEDHSSGEPVAGGIHILVIVSFFLETLKEAVRCCKDGDPTFEARFRFLTNHYKHFPRDLHEWTSSLSRICKDLCSMHMSLPTQPVSTLDKAYLSKWNELKPLACADVICTRHNADGEQREQFISSFHSLVHGLRDLNSFHISTMNLPSLNLPILQREKDNQPSMDSAISFQGSESHPPPLCNAEDIEAQTNSGEPCNSILFKRRSLAVLNKLGSLMEGTLFSLSKGRVVGTEACSSSEAQLMGDSSSTQTQGSLDQTLSMLCRLCVKLRQGVLGAAQNSWLAECRECTVAVAEELDTLVAGLELKEAAMPAAAGWGSPQEKDSVQLLDRELVKKIRKLDLLVKKVDRAFSSLTEIRVSVRTCEVARLESAIAAARDANVEGPDLSAAFCALRKAKQINLLCADLRSAIDSAKARQCPKSLPRAIQNAHGFLMSFSSIASPFSSVSELRETFQQARDLQGQLSQREGVIGSLEQLSDNVDVITLREVVEKAYALELSAEDCSPLASAEEMLRKKCALEDVHAAGEVLKNCLLHLSTTSRISASELANRSAEKLEACLSLCVMLGLTQTRQVQLGLVHHRHFEARSLLLSQGSLSRIPLARVKMTASEVSALFESAYAQVSELLDGTGGFPNGGEEVSLAICDKAFEDANTLILRDLGGQLQAALGEGSEGGENSSSRRSEGESNGDQGLTLRTPEQQDFNFGKPIDDGIEKVVMSPSTFDTMVEESNRNASVTDRVGELQTICRYHSDVWIYKLSEEISLREFKMKIQTRIRKTNFCIKWKDALSGELISVQNDSDWAIAKSHHSGHRAPTESNRIESVWECDACTFLNLDGGLRCEICNTERPERQGASCARNYSQLDIIIEDVSMQPRRQPRRTPTTILAERPVWGTSHRAHANSMLGGGFVGNVRTGHAQRGRSNQALNVNGQSLL